MVYLSVASRSAAFTLAEIVLATCCRRGGNRWLRRSCHHIALIVNDRQYLASTLPSIANDCQTTEMLGDFFKLFEKIAKLPSVAVVASIVNELPVSLQQFCKRSPIHLHQVVNDLRSQPGSNVVATFRNSVTTVDQATLSSGMPLFTF